ncbi:MAG: hypothetical protein AABX89_07470 [Candidatus Thermoplasmatota archaeon]
MTKATPILVSCLLAALALAGCSSAPTGANGAATSPASTFVHIHSVAVDPADSDTLWVATHRGIITGSGDAGWSYTGDDLSDYMGFSLHPTEAGVAYSSGHPTTGGNQGIRKSVDGAKTWTTIALPGKVDCHAMTISAPNTIYCLNSGGGLYRSTNGADFSLAAATGLTIPTFAFATVPGEPTTLLAATAKGIQRSVDRGETWSNYSAVGLPTTSLTFAANNPSIAYAYFAGSNPGMQMSMDGGMTWHATSGKLPVGLTAYSIGVDPQTPNIVYAAGGTTIAKSTDGGASWAVIRSGS